MNFVRALFTIAVVAVAGCSSSSSTPAPDPNALPEQCQAVKVERFKELLIVDPAVVNDPRGRNDINGPWSFRRRMEEFATSPEEASSLAVKWLTSWKARTKVNVFDVPGRPLVEQRGLCNWLRATPANKCDASCETCADRRYELANAPFRLLGIANRADLIEVVDDTSVLGEARFIYGLTNGPGDDPASPPLVMSVIFEYRQPLRGRTRLELATKWHALGSYSAFDEPYKGELEALMSSFTEPGAEPGRPRGSAINQIRTNEREFEWQWDLREFILGPDGINIARLENTPDRSLIGSPQFADFLRSNRAEIMKKRHVLPAGMAGGTISLEPWSAPGVETDVLQAFSAETCNGCHQLKPIDFNFQVSPFKSGIASVSPFLHDPNDTSKDELAHRENVLRRVLCVP